MVGTFGPALFLLAAAPAVALSSDELSREQLKPLTAFRHQHRRAVLRSAWPTVHTSVVTDHIMCQVDGRLCAAAFVQDRERGNGLQWRDVVQCEMGCAMHALISRAHLPMASSGLPYFHACVERQVCVRKIGLTMLGNMAIWVIQCSESVGVTALSKQYVFVTPMALKVSPSRLEAGRASVHWLHRCRGIFTLFSVKLCLLMTW